jgi:hypothetical protein
MAIPNRFGENDAKNTPEDGEGATPLVSWIMQRITRAREVRDEMYEEPWREATRLWRGFWTAKDKNKDSERSRLISPATSQAIEMTVAEQEETIFSREAFFDIDDDLLDEQKDDALRQRDLLIEDFELADVKSAISQTLLNAAIYGTGIAKLNVQLKDIPVNFRGEMVSEPRVLVTLEAIRPDEFIIDPAARYVEEAMYVAHEMLKPIHGIKEKQQDGTYLPGNIGPWNREVRADVTGRGDAGNIRRTDEGAMVLEYFGKVPARMLPNAPDNATGMVEAIVTIANEQTLLRAVETPFANKDRPIIAFQHDTVPGEFWGRSVVEKAYNAQKALDAELRARIDSLALTTSPMLGADITRLPRNPDMRVRPGKVFLTRGRPSEILEPIALQNPSIAAQFQQTGDLERMVQMGTGAMDTATPNNISRRNETASGMSMLHSGFIKRAKRSMYNIERHFLDKLVKKALWRYIQFDPERYGQGDTKFVVHSTMGMMAKEIENQQLTQILGFVPPDSPGHSVVLQAIFENAVSSHKSELHKAIKEMNRPPTDEEKQMQAQMQQLQFRMAQLQAAKEEAEVGKLQAERDKVLAETRLALARSNYENVKADLEDDKVEIQAANAVTGAEKARVARVQTEVASERNQIERRKITQGNTGNAE